MRPSSVPLKVRRRTNRRLRALAPMTAGALRGVELGFTDDCQYKNPRPVAQAEISPFQLLLLP